MTQNMKQPVQDLQRAKEYLEWGIKNEKDGHGFYVKAAETTTSPAGRMMFTNLAKDELEHLKILEAELATLEQDQTFAPLDPAEVHDISRREIPKLFPESELSQITPDTYEMKALQYAIDSEHRAIKMYTQAGEELDNDDARTIFAYLVDQERQHAFILESEYQYLSGSGFHYGKMEFSMEQYDGA